jgi:ribose 5-phosphate isomerase A
MYDSIARNGMKRAAAERAVREVQNGMVLGLGTGTTAAFMLVALARRIGEGLRVTGIPTSEATAAAAQRLGIPLEPMTAGRRIDLTIDGADQIERATLNLIKGGGGALLREKRVAQASRRMIVIADDSKLVARLGTGGKLPVAIEPARSRQSIEGLTALGAAVTLRQADGHSYVTDDGLAIADCTFGAIADAPGLEARISAIPGVVESGLFIGLAEMAIIGGPVDVQILKPASLTSDSVP